MRPRKPAQAGFPPASRDFSRQAASGTTLSHRFVVPPRETVMRPGVLSAYPNHWNRFACGVIAVRAVGFFG